MKLVVGVTLLLVLAVFGAREADMVQTLETEIQQDQNLEGVKNLQEMRTTFTFGGTTTGSITTLSFERRLGSSQDAPDCASDNDQKHTMDCFAQHFGAAAVDADSKWVLSEKKGNEYCVMDVAAVVDDLDSSEDFQFDEIHDTVCSHNNVTTGCCASDAAAKCTAGFCWSGYGEVKRDKGWEKVFGKVSFTQDGEEVTSGVQFSMDLDKKKATMCLKIGDDLKCKAQTSTVVDGTPAASKYTKVNDVDGKLYAKDSNKLNITDWDSFDEGFDTMINGMIQMAAA